MQDIVIVSAARTAVGKFGGTLAKTPAPELGAAVVVDLLRRANLSGDQINELIFGQVLTAGSGQNPARQTVIKAGLPPTTVGFTINKVCGSGLKAVMLAVQAIKAANGLKTDRILVGKFIYQFIDPERWDVIVFKYPGGAVRRNLTFAGSRFQNSSTSCPEVRRIAGPGSPCRWKP